MERTKRRFRKNDKVLLSNDWSAPETKYIHSAKWHNEHGWVYLVGSIPNVTHRGGLATVKESSLSRL